jgi:hypothetical protein
MRRTLPLCLLLVGCGVAVVGLTPRAPLEAAPVPKPIRDSVATALKELVAVMPPLPDSVQPGTDKDWLNLEKEMGIIFPKEYKLLFQTYGMFDVNRFLIFQAPFKKDTNLEGLIDYVDFYRKWANKDEPVWPTEGGILPIAGTICAHTIGYRCNGKPDEWTIVVSPKHGFSMGAQEEHPFGLIEFMKRLATGTLDSKELMYHKEMHPPLQFR